MKYIYTFLIFIGLSSSAFSEGHDTRWILLDSTVWLPSKPPIVLITQELFAQNKTFETESDCYTALKDVALAKNKNRKKNGSGRLYKIQIIDDVKITAQYYAEHYSVSNLHCIEITLSR